MIIIIIEFIYFGNIPILSFKFSPYPTINSIEGQTKKDSYHYDHDYTAKIFREDEGYGIVHTDFDEKTRTHSLKFNYHAALTGSIVDTMTLTRSEQ